MKKFPCSLSYSVIVEPDGFFCEIFKNDKNQLHNPNGPAEITYNKDGSISDQSWYIDGKPHNPNGPAVIYYNKDGSISDQSWYIDGKELTEKQFLAIQTKKNKKSETCQKIEKLEKMIQDLKKSVDCC